MDLHGVDQPDLVVGSTSELASAVAASSETTAGAADERALGEPDLRRVMPVLSVLLVRLRGLRQRREAALGVPRGGDIAPIGRPIDALE